jgi:catechol 2,3-dioxygenase-like lactoylglutathione lyase family enzyme
MDPDHADRYHQARAELAGWLREDRLISREDIREGGVRAFPGALTKLFAGQNVASRCLLCPEAAPEQREGAAAVDMRLEVVMLPVAGVDRAREFYTELGWRLDADFSGDGGFRVVQLTPPGSACSVIFGSGITAATPASAEGLQLVVDDVRAARAELAGHGVSVSDIFHDAGGVFHHAGTEGRVSGPAPDDTSYGSFVSFSDPDGNDWFVQEITTRLPGR